ncbi:MAG: DsbE family thiol:disulfide interchange protein [Alphaproteobacteria bacterium]
MKKLVYLAPLGLFLAALIYFAVGLTMDPSKLPSTLIDRPAPEFALPPIEGKEKGLASEDLQGEVSLLNVFGSWCPGCLAEHPMLMMIANSGAAPLHGLNWKDKPGAGAAWLERHGDPYVRIGDDAAGRVAIDLGVTGAPETYVIDEEGRIRYKHIGPITGPVWRETLRPLIEKLQKDDEKPVDPAADESEPTG